MVEAMHHNLYTIINSAAMNGVGAETTVLATAPAIINTITNVTIAIIAIALILIMFIII
jgi:hypothetical protein